MNALLYRFLGRTIKSGALEIIDAEGKPSRFGDGSGPPVRVRFTTPEAEQRLLANLPLKLGEEFVDGGYLMEAGRVYDFLALILANVNEAHGPKWAASVPRDHSTSLVIKATNTEARARENVARHYDLDKRLFSLFLDKDLQYSCAYFEDQKVDLDEAQRAKKRHLAAKLAIKTGQRVLDIGSGWGGLGLYLAESADVELVGVTLSEQQLAVCNARAAERGLSSRVQFLLKDYRNLEGSFDRIVSVGMFEHVGSEHYSEFFTKCSDLLAPDGVMVLHSIMRSDGPGEVNPWIRKYIFPGSHVPALSEVVPEVEQAGLVITDVEILRLHYAQTLRAWRERFLARRDEAKALYDERFCRMWEFYLAAGEASFRYQGLMNFQIQMVKDIEALPLTRDYIASAEERLRMSDQKR